MTTMKTIMKYALLDRATGNYVSTSYYVDGISFVKTPVWMGLTTVKRHRRRILLGHIAKLDIVSIKVIQTDKVVVVDDARFDTVMRDIIDQNKSFAKPVGQFQKVFRTNDSRFEVFLCNIEECLGKPKSKGIQYAVLLDFKEDLSVLKNVIKFIKENSTVFLMNDEELVAMRLSLSRPPLMMYDFKNKVFTRNVPQI